MWIECHGCLHTCILDRSDGAVQVGAHFVVDIHRVHLEGSELTDELHRLHDHEMHIQRLLDQRTNGLEDRETKGDIGYEDPVHHIDM